MPTTKQKFAAFSTRVLATLPNEFTSDEAEEAFEKHFKQLALTDPDLYKELTEYNERMVKTMPPFDPSGTWQKT